MPKVSIILVTYNSETSIEKTLNSIINQKYDDFELILLDRNSKDKTLEIAGKYKERIKKWISEPDKNYYDTLNKGILLAQGEYILFLNSGDIFTYMDALKNASLHLNENDIISFNADIYNIYDNKTTKYVPKYNKKYYLIEGETFLAAEFIKRNLLEASGGFDTRFKILGSKEFNLRTILKEGAKTKHINETYVKITKNKDKIISAQKARRIQKEQHALRKIYFNKFQIFMNKIMYKLL